MALTATARARLQALGYDGGGFQEDAGDLSYGGLEPDPTAGDLGTLPDPMTTLPVTETGSGDNFDFGASDAFMTAGSEPVNTVPNAQDVGTIGTQVGQDTGGGVDPTKDTTTTSGTVGGFLSGILGGVSDLLNGGSSNRGIGSPSINPNSGYGSPSSPVKTNPTTKPVGFIDITNNSGFPFLIVFGVLLFVLWRKG